MCIRDRETDEGVGGEVRAGRVAQDDPGGVQRLFAISARVPQAGVLDGKPDPGLAGASDIQIMGLK